MQMHRCERSSFRSFLIAALFLTKNVAPQFGAGVGSDVATCSASFSSVAFLDVGFNGRSHGRSRARRLRRGFCSGSSYGLLLDLKRRGLDVPPQLTIADGALGFWKAAGERSEEHTSELQSRQYLVCRLLLEK